MVSEIDEVDLKIINELLENARKPFREIAKKIQLSDVAIIKRVRKLEKVGAIRKYALILDPSKLGFNKVSITGINVRPEKLLEVASKLKEKPYIKFLAIGSGDHEILAMIWARDSEEIMKIHEEFRNIDGVIEVYPCIVSEVLKREAYI